MRERGTRLPSEWTYTSTPSIRTSSPSTGNIRVALQLSTGTKGAPEGSCIKLSHVVPTVFRRVAFARKCGLIPIENIPIPCSISWTSTMTLLNWDAPSSLASTNAHEGSDMANFRSSFTEITMSYCTLRLRSARASPVNRRRNNAVGTQAGRPSHTRAG